MTIRGFGEDTDSTRQRVTPGTARRALPYARPYRWTIAALLLLTSLVAVAQVASPLLLKMVIDEGIIPRHKALVVWLALAVAGLALLEAVLTFTETWLSGKISEGLVYDLRTEVFDHVQRQPIAFFTRTQTGSLVSRLNTDVVAAQQAVTTLLSQSVSSLLSLILVLGTMFYLSWQITLLALVALPLFLLPGRLVGRRLQGLMRESMQLNAEMGTLMHERFNIAGALLAKLYGRPDNEKRLFTERAGRVRDIGVVTTVYSRMLLVSVTLLGSLATALVYGLGGVLVVDGSFQLGTLVALAVLLTRLFGPINQLSSMQASVMTALVSFDRLFEVLDLKPLIAQKPGAVALDRSRGAPDIEFDAVSFRYPKAAEVSLSSLQGHGAPPERGDDALTLDAISFRVPAGTLTALVGPSGAGKTTITQLVPRLYDPVSGTVRIGGHDVRDLTFDCLRDTVGMVTQDAHLFHDTLRANLLYARPDAEERELVEACKAAQIWDLIAALPDGLDTVVGDRGYRFSGGEKQRLAIARLLLKAPSIVVLDEATAHLDSESEAAIQQALKTALRGRTSLVIAHRLSTIRDADQILVVDAGRIVERGTHEELLEAGGLYAELHRTQFTRQPSRNGAAPAPAGPGYGDPNGAGLPPLEGCRPAA
ncbi:ABC transporter ATP-binding protein [Actinomadura keratinilytica]|uniref:ABC transporter ATP-binding protein n=1 Tax=Actinomadura keratinilytica TaxID=547461 RepID=UPI003616C65B